MKGVYFTGDRNVVVREAPMPSPGPGEVLVRMRASAVCGSDLHRYRLPKDKLGAFANFIVGHEPCGDVVALGEGVFHSRVGDRVVVFHRRGCGDCQFCRSGEIGYCATRRRSHGGQVDGGDGDYVVTDERNCWPLPEDLSYATGAVLACNGGTAYMGVRKLGARGGLTLAVSGLGPVGLCAVLVGKAMGARVVGIDVSDGRLMLARELGADAVVDAKAGDPVADMRSLTGGGPDLAIETSGNPRGQKTMIDFLGFRGRACVVGLGGGQGLINLSDLINKQATVFGSSIFSAGEYYEMLEFIRRTGVDFERVITHRFTIEQAPEAFRTADSAATGKSVFIWDTPAVDTTPGAA